MGNMKANRKFKEGQEAVSAVIGVILMVAITVAIAATVYVYVSGMVGGNAKSTPTVSLIPDGNDQNCTITLGSVSSSGVLWSDVTYTLVNKTQATQFIPTTFGTAHAWGTSTAITVGNPTTQTNMAGGQIITIKGAPIGLTKGSSYTLTPQYRPTGGTLGTASWTQ